jgi:hypothetical protein
MLSKEFSDMMCFCSLKSVFLKTTHRFWSVLLRTSNSFLISFVSPKENCWMAVLGESVAFQRVLLYTEFTMKKSR